MDKPAAFYTFQVKMLGAALPIRKLITGACAFADNHFFNQALAFKLFEGAVNGGGADPVSLLTEVKQNVGCGGVRVIFSQKC